MQEKKKPDTRLINDAELDRVAEIRLKNFPESSITALGIETSRRFVEWLVKGPHNSFALGAYVDGKLVGHLIAGHFHHAHSGFIEKNRAYIVRYILTHPQVLTKPFVRQKIVDSLRYALFLRYPKEVRLVPDPETMIPEQMCGMLDWAVDPDFQGYGVGRILMEVGEDIARERGFTYANCSVLKTNEKVIQFHQRRGYEIVMERPRSVHLRKKL